METTESAPASVEGRSEPCLTLSEAVLLFVLAAVQFTHIVDFMIVMPLGPIYAREMGLLPHQFGHVVAAYTISAGLAALFASGYLDRFGRKAALLTLYSGFTIGTGLCAIAPDYWSLLAARTVAGAFGGVAASVVLAVVGDAFAMHRRGLAMGVIMSAFSVASIAGVPIGLWIAEGRLGWHGPFIALAGLGGIVLTLAFIALPPLRGHIGQANVRPVSMAGLIRNPNHIRAFFLMASLVFGSFTIGPYLPAYLVNNVGLEQTDLKYMYLAGGLTTLITLTYIGRLADRFGKLLVFRILAAATVGTVLLLTNLPTGLSLAMVLVATTLMWIATSGRMVPATALMTAAAIPSERGGFMSINAAVQHLAAGAATWLGGLLLSQASKDAPLVGFPLVGVVSCVATVASIYLAGRLRMAPGGELAPDSPELIVAETEAEVAAS